MYLMIKMVSFAAIVSLFSCSSSKKSTGEDAMPSTNVEQNSLKLNGDSDSSSAGGISTIYFDFDSAALQADARATLDANASFLKANTAVAVQIEGHCDERGGVQYNLALSEKRAKTVRDYLKSQGIAENRMTTIGYGKEKPVDLGHDDAAWARNRRANFVITAK